MTLKESLTRSGKTLIISETIVELIRYVANELKLGRPVPPKLFTSATVLFSDIVGFTSLCSTSTPLEVVNMLNGIYTGFDECIARHGAYKVSITSQFVIINGMCLKSECRHHRSSTLLWSRHVQVNSVSETVYFLIAVTIRCQIWWSD